MKTILFISFCLLFACSQPKHIKFNPDDQARTSGTLGSAKATTQLPKETIDTTARRDTLNRRKEK